MKEPHIKIKSINFGPGCLIQLIGLVLLFVFFPIGLIVGILLLIIGQRLSFKFICSECNNRLDNSKVKICPVCKAQLKPPPWWSIPI